MAEDIVERLKKRARDKAAAQNFNRARLDAGLARPYDWGERAKPEDFDDWKAAAEIERLRADNQTLLSNRDALAHGEQVALHLYGTERKRAEDAEGQCREHTARVVAAAIKLQREWPFATSPMTGGIQNRECTRNLERLFFETLELVAISKPGKPQP